MFARNKGSGTIGNYSKAKVYYCKIWNGGNLVFDAIPVRVGQVGYMYDRVSGQLFGNSGSGDFVLGNDVSGGGDEQVTVLDSLDSENIITFNTGISLTAANTWSVDSVPDASTAWGLWVWCWDASTSWNSCDSFIVQHSNNTSVFYVYIGKVGYQTFSPQNSRVQQGYDGTKYYCGTFTKTFTAKNFDSRWPLKVRSNHIYGVKIWNSGTLVNDFVPAKRGTDYGMYDTVSQTFIKLF
jgi:hypothetical protein